MFKINENKIINIIKFVPPFFIILILILSLAFFYSTEKENFIKEKNYIKKQYIKNKKELLKSETNQFYKFILNIQKEEKKRIKDNIKNRVYEAYTIATNIYETNKNTKTKEEITKMIKNTLASIRFNENRGYYYIYDLDYKCILLPIDRKLEGKNLYNLQDAKGTYVIREMVKNIKKNKESFFTWWYKKPNIKSQKQYKKIGFNLYFEPLNWFIGSGEYYVDIDKNIKKAILSYPEKFVNEKSNHYFILDFDGTILFHLNKNFIYKKAFNVDIFSDNKNFSIKDLLLIAKKSDGFISYSSTNDSSNIIYTKGVKSLNWAIGKFFNSDEIKDILIYRKNELESNFNKNISKFIIFTSLLAIIFIIFSFLLSKTLEKRFINHQKEKIKQQHILEQQSKMASMGEMIGNIAHQWRQPLSVITTITTGIKLQKQIDKLDDETFDKALDDITNSANYLSNTIDDFRNFFKSENITHNFNINEVFEKVLKLTNAQLKNNDINIITNIKNFSVRGIENEFLQVLINVINNSKDALENIKDDKYIFIDSYIEKNLGIIEIKDNALGIKPEIIDKVCEPYFTTKHQAKGTGIGLYMSNEIITNHMNGKFNIYNTKYTYEWKEFKGTLVKIELNTIII